MSTNQLLFIHGGEVFKTYEDYIHFLKDLEIKSEDLDKKRWKDSLAAELGNEFEVIRPQMPCAVNAKFAEWKIYFEHFLPFLRDGVILMGHSLGGIFLAKYLAENDFPVKIKATILVAAPFEDDFEPLGDFNFSTDLAKLNEQGGEIVLVQSQDDKVVPFFHFEKFTAALPQSKTIIFTDRGHFLQESFPEMVELVKGMV